MRINKNLLTKIKNINLSQLLLGGLQMTSYKIPDEITKKVQSINSNEKTKDKLKEFYAKLDQVSNSFNVTSNQNQSEPQKVELQKMEFKMPTESEIKQNSEELLKEYKQSGIQGINDEYKLKSDALESNKQSVINSADSTKQKLNSYYSEAKNNAEAQALKRGLARSSIIINQLGAFDQEKIADYKQLDDELNTQINAINFELNALSAQKQNALNNFNVSYAVKLQEKINDLTEELNNKQSEVTKYNNEIALKEAEFNKDVDELKSKLEQAEKDGATNLVEIYGKYGQNIVEKVKADQLYSTAKQMLYNLSADEIKWILADNEFKKRMGSNYIKLLEEFS